jgi:hypothetical protein
MLPLNTDTLCAVCPIGLGIEERPCSGVGRGLAAGRGCHSELPQVQLSPKVLLVGTTGLLLPLRAAGQGAGRWPGCKCTARVRGPSPLLFGAGLLPW